MSDRSKVNDFVVRFANVNGTGSASANLLFAKAIFRMGIFVTPKNIFPSNIQGLPTWYDVRVSEKGYLGRREGVDLMVCVNPQSMKKDVQSVKPGGYFLYDSTKGLNPEFVRDDISYIGVPLMEMCIREYSDPRQRQLFKNIIYVGALAALLHIEMPVLEQLLAEQFQGKEKLVSPNVKALELGRSFIYEHYADLPFNLRVERRDLLGDHIMLDGNSACGLGAVYAGATVASWYPITPSTSVVEAYADYCKQFRVDAVSKKNKYAIVQAEDELAAIGMAIGACWNGARAFTATSGPGLSLMNEFLGLAYFAEIPVVLIDVQRSGPSTGMPTRTQQSDLHLAAYASHGDTKQIVILPATPSECFELTAEAFELTEFFQTPVLVLTDLDLGMNDHISAPLEWDDSKAMNRGKVLSAADLDEMERFGRYLDVDGDGVPYRTIPGVHPSKGSYFTRGTSRDEYAVYTEESEAYVRNMQRLERKWETIKERVPAPKAYQKSNQQELGLLFFGTSIYACEEAMDMLKEEGIKMDAMRLRAFPFQQTVIDFIAEHKRVYLVEQNRDAQMKSLLVNELGVNPQQIISILNYDGMPITADHIVAELKKEVK